MAIDKLIEKHSKPSIFKLAGTNISIVETENVKSDLLELKEELMKEPVNIEYNRKVKVPQFVADWLKYCNERNRLLYGAMTTRNEMNDETKSWLVESTNQLVFAKAYEHGYEVEEGPRYRVVIPMLFLIA